MSCAPSPPGAHPTHPVRCAAQVTPVVAVAVLRLGDRPEPLAGELTAAAAVLAAAFAAALVAPVVGPMSFCAAIIVTVIAEAVCFHQLLLPLWLALAGASAVAATPLAATVCSGQSGRIWLAALATGLSLLGVGVQLVIAYASRAIWLQVRPTTYDCNLCEEPLLQL